MRAVGQEMGLRSTRGFPRAAAGALCWWGVGSCARQGRGSAGSSIWLPAGFPRAALSNRFSSIYFPFFFFPLPSSSPSTSPLLRLKHQRRGGLPLSPPPTPPPPPVPSLPPWGPSAIRPGWPRGQEPTVGAGSSELLLHGTIGLEQTKRPEQSASTARSFALLLIFFPLSFPPPPLFFCWCRQNPRGRKRGRKEERPGGKQKRGLNKAWGGRGGALGWAPPVQWGSAWGAAEPCPVDPPPTSWLP